MAIFDVKSGDFLAKVAFLVLVLSRIDPRKHEPPEAGSRWVGTWRADRFIYLFLFFVY